MSVGGACIQENLPYFVTAKLCAANSKSFAQPTAKVFTGTVCSLFYRPLDCCVMGQKLLKNRLLWDMIVVGCWSCVLHSPGMYLVYTCNQCGTNTVPIGGIEE